MSTWSGAAKNLRVPKFAEEAVERARLAVVPRARQKAAPRIPFAILVGLVLLGGVAGLLLFNTHMQKNSFMITDLEAQATALHAKEQSLRMELDELRDPQRLADRALAMGMVPPDSPAFLDLRTGRVLGNPNPSTGVNSFGIDAPAARKPGELRPDPIVLEREVIIRPERRTDGAAATATGRRDGTNGDQRD